MTLTDLYDHSCTRCPLHENAQTVCIPASGRGLYNALIVGEAPGRNEDEQGVPFIGQAGKTLDRVLREAFLTDSVRDEISVTNAVKCRPTTPSGGFNLSPRDLDIIACVSAYLTHEITAVDAYCLLALGNAAAYALLGRTGIAVLRGTWHRLDSERTRWVRVTWHPAYVGYQGGLKGEVGQQFRDDVNHFAGRVISRMGEGHPDD